MKIIIAGAGEVGFHLAKLLSYEAQEITLIDIDKERLAYADTHLDIRALHGNATSIKVLQDAQVQTSDLVIGVTASETINITLCLLAKQLGCKKTIARVSNTEFTEQRDLIKFENLGIDDLISPEELAADEIQLILDQAAFNDTYQFDQGIVTLLGVILPKSASFIDKNLKEIAEIFPELHFMPLLLQPKDTQHTLIPAEDTVFKAGDRVYFMALDKGVEELYKLTRISKKEIKNVMILGGSEIGFKTARDLCSKDYQVKLIEKNKEKAVNLADELPHAFIINGDGSNVELLEEENLAAMDAFIAVTKNSETNIIACLLAKSKQIKKTIALVENIDYFQLSHSIGVDTLINKKLITANAIFRYTRKGKVLALTRLSNLNMEILEFEVKPTSRISGKLLKDLDFSGEARIGAIIRQGEGIIPLDDFKIMQGDRVVICCFSKALSHIENLFL